METLGVKFVCMDHLLKKSAVASLEKSFCVSCENLLHIQVYISQWFSNQLLQNLSLSLK